MKDDPVISRIRKVRTRISEECNHNPKKLVEHYIELEKKHKRRFISVEKEIQTAFEVKREV